MDAGAEPTPDLFFDQYHFSIGTFGVAIGLGASVPMKPGDLVAVVRPLPTLRLAPSTAKVLAFQLVRRLAAFEQTDGEITVSPKLLNQCAIGAEDWTDFWARARSPEVKP